MTQSQYEVFICYETTSKFDLAVNLRESLRRVNIKAFVAELDIPKGEEWEPYRDDVIENCKHFVAIIDNVALFSDEVRREVNLAKRLGKVIIPCIRENTRDKLLEEATPFNQLMRIQGVFHFHDKYELSSKVVDALLKDDYYLNKGLEKLFKKHSAETTPNYGETCIKLSTKRIMENIQTFVKAVESEEEYNAIFKKFKEVMINIKRTKGIVCQ